MNEVGDSLLEVRRLIVTFEGGTAEHPVLDRLSFSLQRGETLGLVGGSGEGKTLTALAILRLLPAAAAILGGEIRFQGVNLLTAPAREIRQIRGRKIAMVFQEPRSSLHPLMRIEDQLIEGMVYCLGYSPREAAEKGRELLLEVGIDDPERCLHSYSHQLSGGMQQRVLIAGALSCEPQLLICDEITSSIDSLLRVQLMALLGRLRRERNLSILMITHDLQSLRRLADRVVVLLHGRVVEEGATETLLSRPAHPYTRELIASFQGLKLP